ncbi:hypothetical protein [Caldisericum sp.]|uniref:Uncharacterized protein n=1 Tax=Caldisericum exile TaxID=693075 RepID=A0A2J6WFW9_9BACT|nr:MAG: hypothetical protein C0189_00575 [Caldisericum exile]
MRTKSFKLINTLAFISLAAYIAMHFNYSTLFACMDLGTVAVNTLHNESEYFDGIDFFSETLLLVLFTIVSACFDINYRIRGLFDNFLNFTPLTNLKNYI